MKKSTSNNGTGISFGGLLTIVFITLKLTHVIDWSWWWILAPLWITAGIILTVFAVALFIIGLSAWLDKP